MSLIKFSKILQAKLIQLGLIISLALFFCPFLSNSNCFAMSGRVAASITQATLTGKVTESGTTRVLAGAEVTIRSVSGRLIARALTNTQGTYSISIPYKGYFLNRCYLQGYGSQVTMKQLIPGRTITQNFALIMVANKPPVITATTPADASEYLAGAKIILEINAYDPNAGDTLQYQFSIGGTVKQAWSSLKTFSWQTQASDTGTISILFEAKDSKGLKTTKTITIRIINPTAQQILQRVADNYAKIKDYKSDMEMSSTLDGNPFGQTQYCRYYYMAPDKEKTESFSDNTKVTKTDIIIINNTNMHLINPIKNIKQTVDLLKDREITEAEYKQGDIYYNLPAFLTQHTLLRNNTFSNLNEKLVYIEATPKLKGKMYDKLGFLIDYSKGILSKLQIYQYNGNNLLELLQETITVSSKQFSNGAWLPTKMTKTPNLTGNVFISTATYPNLQINLGLTALDFDPTKQ